MKGWPVQGLVSASCMSSQPPGQIQGVEAQITPATTLANLACRFVTCKKWDAGLSSQVRSVPEWSIISGQRTVVCSRKAQRDSRTGHDRAVGKAWLSVVNPTSFPTHQRRPPPQTNPRTHPPPNTIASLTLPPDIFHPPPSILASSTYSPSLHAYLPTYLPITCLTTLYLDTPLS